MLTLVGPPGPPTLTFFCVGLVWVDSTFDEFNTPVVIIEFTFWRRLVQVNSTFDEFNT